MLENIREYQLAEIRLIKTERNGNIMCADRVAHCCQRNRLFFFSFSFFVLSLSDSLILGAGDSEDTLGPASPSACAGVDPEPDVASRRRLPKIGMPDMEPARFVVTEIRRARRWKFWEEIRLRLDSDSGSGVPARSGVDTPCANVIPGVCVVEGAFCDAVSSDVLVGKAIGAESDVGKVTGLALEGAASLTGPTPKSDERLVVAASST
jgi:hypothetical protein